jgi:hypothetical protein
MKGTRMLCRSNRLITIFLAVSCTFWSEGVRAQQAGEVMEQILRLVSDPYGFKDCREGASLEVYWVPSTADPCGLRDRDEKFDRLMDQLATDATPEQISQARAQEGSELEAKLLVLAVDRKERSGVYKEIDDHYVNCSLCPDYGSRRESLKYRLPHLSHAGEKFRLPFEYFLLSPVRSPVRNIQYRGHMYFGISRVRDERSIVFLAPLCEAVGADPRIEGWEKGAVISAMLDFPREDVLRQMLECFERIEKSSSQFPWQASNILSTMIRVMDPQFGTAWQLIVQPFATQGLSDRQAAVVQEIKRRYGWYVSRGVF